MKDNTLKEIANELRELANKAEAQAATSESPEWYYGRATAFSHAARLLDFEAHCNAI